MENVRPFWLAGKATTSDNVGQIKHPGDGRVVGQHYVPNAAQVEQAVAAAYAARGEFQATTAALRSEVLTHVANEISKRAEELARLITDENGKPLTWARSEVSRATLTFKWAAEEEIGRAHV